MWNAFIIVSQKGEEVPLSPGRHSSAALIIDGPAACLCKDRRTPAVNCGTSERRTSSGPRKRRSEWNAWRRSTRTSGRRWNGVRRRRAGPNRGCGWRASCGSYGSSRATSAKGESGWKAPWPEERKPRRRPGGCRSWEQVTSRAARMIGPERGSCMRRTWCSCGSWSTRAARWSASAASSWERRPITRRAWPCGESSAPIRASRSRLRISGLKLYQQVGSRSGIAECQEGLPGIAGELPEARTC